MADYSVNLKMVFKDPEPPDSFFFPWEFEKELEEKAERYQKAQKEKQS